MAESQVDVYRQETPVTDLYESSFHFRTAVMLFWVNEINAYMGKNVRRA